MFRLESTLFILPSKSKIASDTFDSDALCDSLRRHRYIELIQLGDTTSDTIRWKVIRLLGHTQQLSNVSMTATPLLDTELSFGDWLRRRRGGLGLTQAEFAKQLGCAVITLRKFEAEERHPSQEMAERIAAVLQVPAEQSATFVRFARGELRAGERLTVDDIGAGAGKGVLRAQLPIPPYAIIGREDALERASDAIIKGRARVLTLVGPPGVGKTRLALELAHTLRAHFADGAAFVELLPVRSAALVPSAIAEALRIEDSTSADTAEAVLVALRDRHILLVLDNFEHVIDAAPFVAELASRCARLTCIVTSRERLRIRTEHALQVSVLDVPQAATLRDVQAASASRLFIARASQACAQWSVSEEDVAPIAALCAQLEGLPLALELLAARADLFTPTQLLADLQHGLNALESGARDAPKHHRGLRAAIEWSLRLLSESQQALFAHLSVFAGSFDAEAAQAVFAHDALDLVTLARASLIQSPGADRWRMLEPIREFASEVLARSGDLEMEETSARYAAHFAEVAQAARSELLGFDAERWTARLEADCDNMQAAVQWALRAHRSDYALRIGQGIFRFWHRRGMWRDGLGWLEAALQLDRRNEDDKQAPLDIRARATRAAGTMANALSQFDRAERHFQASLELSKRLADDEQVAATYVSLGMLRRDQGRFDESLAYFDQAIPLEPEHALKFPWQNKADVLVRLGRFDEAEVLYRQAMVLNRRIGDDEGLAHTLRGLGEIAWRRGDADAAERHLHDNEVLHRKLNHARGLSWTAQQLGNTARTRGDWQAAAAHYTDALAQMDRMGDRRGMCEVLTECGHLAVATGRFELAAYWIGMAQTGFRALDARLTPYESGLIEADLQQCESKLEREVLRQALERGVQGWHEDDTAQVTAVLMR